MELRILPIRKIFPYRGATGFVVAIMWRKRLLAKAPTFGAAGPQNQQSRQSRGNSRRNSGRRSRRSRNRCAQQFRGATRSFTWLLIIAFGSPNRRQCIAPMWMERGNFCVHRPQKLTSRAGRLHVERKRQCTAFAPGRTSSSMRTRRFRSPIWSDTTSAPSSWPNRKPDVCRQTGTAKWWILNPNHAYWSQRRQAYANGPHLRRLSPTASFPRMSIQA